MTSSSNHSHPHKCYTTALFPQVSALISWVCPTLHWCISSACELRKKACLDIGTLYTSPDTLQCPTMSVACLTFLSLSVPRVHTRSDGAAEMLNRFILSILLQGLILFLLGPACDASSLGLTVHAVPLDSDDGRTVGNVFSLLLSLITYIFYHLDTFFIIYCGFCAGELIQTIFLLFKV